MTGKARGGDVAAGGSKRRLSFLSGGGGSGDTALVYGLVAVSFLVTNPKYGSVCVFRAASVLLYEG